MKDGQSKPIAGVAARGFPPPPTAPWFYRFRHFLANPHLAIHDMTRQFGDFMRWRGFYDVYVVNHPEFIRAILAQDTRRFSKRIIDYRVLAQVMGSGLVTSDGPHWQRQRKLLQPAFGNRNVNGFEEAINGFTSSLMREWDMRAGDEVVWLDREMSRLTFEIVGATLFGGGIERHAEEVSEILHVVNLNPQEPRALRTLHPWIPTPYNLKWKRAMKRLDSIVHAMIAARRRAGTGGGDVLDRLIDARDAETGEDAGESMIRDEIVTLMLAGHETSSIALTWTLYLLAMHPDVEARLTEELAGHLNGAPARAADLPRIPYLKQVVQESMRLYPPVWGLARRTEWTMELGGHELPANAYVTVVPYALHRHPEFWPDPERFDPDRFQPNRSQGRHSYSYLPFAAGPRTCIGAGMAMLEVQLILAQVVQRFEVRVVPDHPIETEPKVTLRPRHGMPVVLRRRRAGSSTPAGKRSGCSVQRATNA